MAGHIAIDRIEFWMVRVRFGDRGLQVVANHHLGHCAEEGQGPHMRTDPTANLLIGGRFHIGVIGASQGGYEDLRLHNFAVDTREHLHSRAGKVHKELVACVSRMTTFRAPFQSL